MENDITLDAIFRTLERLKGSSINATDFKYIHDNSKAQVELSCIFEGNNINNLKELYEKVKEKDIANSERACTLREFKDLKVTQTNKEGSTIIYSFPFGYKEYMISLTKVVY